MVVSRDYAGQVYQVGDYAIIPKLGGPSGFLPHIVFGRVVALTERAGLPRFVTVYPNWKNNWVPGGPRLVQSTNTTYRTSEIPAGAKELLDQLFEQQVSDGTVTAENFIKLMNRQMASVDSLTVAIADLEDACIRHDQQIEEFGIAIRAGKFIVEGKF